MCRQAAEYTRCQNLDMSRGKYMAYQLTILWLAWWAGAALITLGLVILNARRRRSAQTGDEKAQAALPTLRDDLTWGALILLGGGIGLGVILWLLKDGHTSRGLLAAAIFGPIMLLGLLMLLKNGLAPTDVLRLEAEEASETASLGAPEEEGLSL